MHHAPDNLTENPKKIGFSSENPPDSGNGGPSSLVIALQRIIHLSDHMNSSNERVSRVNDAFQDMTPSIRAVLGTKCDTSKKHVVTHTTSDMHWNVQQTK
jgi:hypothetical protein